MSGGNIADIILGQPDYSGQVITTIFSKISGVYAVYANTERVMVQYADDPEIASLQRKTFTSLAPVRGEINGLIDGWRGSFLPSTKARARRYDRRTADALIVALQGDPETAKALLQAVRNDILEERTSLGRLHYLGMAVAVGVVISVLSRLPMVFDANETPNGIGGFFTHYNLWMTSSLGCLGALFSIAIGIKGRAIQTDLRPRDNLIDASLRMLIGAISAFVLLTLFKSKVVGFSLGNGENIAVCEAGQCASNGAAVIIAFLAGFSERLVGNLLDSKIIPGLNNGDTTVDVATRAGEASQAASDAASRNERESLANERGVGQATEDFAEQVEDGCLCDHEIDEVYATDDVELPKASGGIERPAAA